MTRNKDADTRMGRLAAAPGWHPAWPGDHRHVRFAEDLVVPDANGVISGSLVSDTTGFLIISPYPVSDCHPPGCGPPNEIELHVDTTDA
jgi:hypothetical protein